MADEVTDFLSKLPAEKRVDSSTQEYLAKEINRGGELNALQRDTVLDLVGECVAKNLLPPKQFEAFCAFAYAEWTSEAKTDEKIKPRLAQFVKLLKTKPDVAGRVAQIAQSYVKNRQARRAEMKKFLEAASAHAAESSVSSQTSAKASSNEYVAQMQRARHGEGANPVPNLELAVTIAEEAIDAHPTSPKVLFEAAGCFQLLADTGTLHSVTNRYVYMRQAYALYQQCLTILSEPPYGKLEGEYDIWRKGIVKLIPIVQKKLENLERRQSRLT